MKQYARVLTEIELHAGTSGDIAKWTGLDRRAVAGYLCDMVKTGLATVVGERCVGGKPARLYRATGGESI